MAKAEQLPRLFYTASQSRELDRTAIEEFHIPGITLMERAGLAAFQLLLQVWPNTAELTVLCGTGNNGGDGFIIATLARQRNITVKVLLVGAAGKISGDARLAYDMALQENVLVEAFSGKEQLKTGVLVDALLGTGLTGEVRGQYAAAIALANDSGLPILAVDIPSGLCSDTGRVLGAAINAAHTVTFIGVKQGLLTAQGPACCGQIHFAGLDVPDPVYQQVPFNGRRTGLWELAKALPPRPRDAHKGLFGHVLVVGGDYGMAGAAVMAAEAAARVGAGLVSVASHPEHVAAFIARRPEIMAHGIVSGQELEPLLKKPTAIVIGPGLGRSPWSEQLLQQVMKTDCPLVVDADALNILSEGRVHPKPGRHNWILTPHPGEAARLLNSDTAAVLGDRFAAARQLQKRYSGVAVLKGAGTLIAAENALYLCDQGNPGMASGGMGDVLSGIIGGLFAQGLAPALAARLGVSLHARAADLAVRADGERGLLATDLLKHLRQLVNSGDHCGQMEQQGL
jgi:NAD(P)H-hydrate epimerase